MAAHGDDFTTLAPPEDAAAKLEGWVWVPDDQASAARSRPTEASM